LLGCRRLITAEGRRLIGPSAFLGAFCAVAEQGKILMIFLVHEPVDRTKRLDSRGSTPTASATLTSSRPASWPSRIDYERTKNAAVLYEAA
jgi:hypothetical protein